jgi:hypothetical protein
MYLNAGKKRKHKNNKRGKENGLKGNIVGGVDRGTMCKWSKWKKK